MKNSLCFAMIAGACALALAPGRLMADTVFFDDFGAPPAAIDTVLAAETGSWSTVTTGGTGGAFGPRADTADLFGRGAGNGVLGIIRGTATATGRANLATSSSVGSLSFELHEPASNTQTLFLQFSTGGVPELRLKDGVISGAGITLPATVPYAVGARVRVDVLWNFTAAAVTDNGLTVPARSVAIHTDGVLRQTGTVGTTAGAVAFVAISATSTGASFLLDELAIDRSYRIASETTRVRDLVINGGGKVTGVEFHPTVAGLHYIRTDTTGLLRRRAGDIAWFELTGMFTPAYGEELAGVDAIAAPAGDANLLLAVFNNNKSRTVGTTSTPNGGIFRSTDQGASWTKVLSIDSPQGNNDTPDSLNSRDHGPSMIFDPSNPAVIYHGSRKNGLWRSLSGGVAGSWTQIGGATLPIPASVVGTRCVAIDPSGPSVGAGTAADPLREARVFAGVYQDGVYRSIDGGATFAKMTSFNSVAGTYPVTSGSTTVQRPAFPLQMRADAAGNLYATHANGLARLPAGTDTWVNFTPSGATGQFLALAINPLNNQEILAAQGRRIHRTADGGASWSVITNFNASNQADNTLSMRWNATKRPWFLYGVGNIIKSLAFDPAADNRVVLTDVYGVWRTADVFETVTSWDDYTAGLENTASLTGATPPAKNGATPSAFYSGTADVTGFNHADLGTTPARMLNPGRPNITGIDYSESNPAVLVAASMDVQGMPQEFQGRVYRSANAGDTWTEMTRPYGTATVRACKLAVSSAAVAANLSDLNVVVVGSNGPRPWKFTTDGGLTWTSAADITNANLPGAKEYILDQLLAADRVTGGTFYAILPGSARTEFWRSTNRGANWQLMAAALNVQGVTPELGVAAGYLPAALGTVHVEAAPGVAGTVWVSLGRNGLWRSADGGASFTRVTGFDPAQQIRFSFGKEKPGAAVPSVYVWSSVNAEWGFFRSTDLGAGWDQISDATRPGQQVKFLRGDRQTYGRVFVGDGARGFYYWELAP